MDTLFRELSTLFRSTGAAVSSLSGEDFESGGKNFDVGPRSAAAAADDAVDSSWNVGPGFQAPCSVDTDVFMEPLKGLYALMFTPSGKWAVAHVLGLDENLDAVLPFLTAPESPACRGYALGELRQIEH